MLAERISDLSVVLSPLYVNDLVAFVWLRENGSGAKVNRLSTSVTECVMKENGSIDMAGYTDLHFNWDNLNRPIKTVVRSEAGIEYANPIFITRARDSHVGQNLIFAIGGINMWISFIVLYIPLFTVRVFISRNPDFKSKLVIRGTPVFDAIWFLGVAIIAGLYSNFLAIYLYHKPPVVPLFSNMKEYSDLIASGKCRLVLTEYFADPELNEYYGLYIYPPENTTQGYNTLSKIKENMRRANKIYPPIVRKNEEGVAKLVEKSKIGKCYIGMAYNQYEIERQHCSLNYISLSDMGSFMYTFGYSLNFSRKLINEIDTFLVQGSMNDFYQNLLVKYAASTPKINCRTKPNVPLNMHQLKDVFSVLLVAAFSALLIFSVEFIRGTFVWIPCLILILVQGVFF